MSRGLPVPTASRGANSGAALPRSLALAGATAEPRVRDGSSIGASTYPRRVVRLADALASHVCRRDRKAGRMVRNLGCLRRQHGGVALTEWRRSHHVGVSTGQSQCGEGNGNGLELWLAGIRAWMEAGWVFLGRSDATAWGGLPQPSAALSSGVVWVVHMWLRIAAGSCVVAGVAASCGRCIVRCDVPWMMRTTWALSNGRGSPTILHEDGQI